MSVIDRSPTRSGGFVPKLPTRIRHELTSLAWAHRMPIHEKDD